MDIERLSKQFNKSKGYEAIVETEGYKILKEEKTNYAHRVGELVIQNGLKENIELQEKIVRAKTYLDLFEEIEVMAKQKERLEESLKKQGVSVR